MTSIPAEAVEAALDALPYQAADYVDTDTMRGALEAAAPHMLAVVSTAEELDALPVGSVIRTSGTDDTEPAVAVKLSNINGSDWDVANNDSMAVMSSEFDDLPATVLHAGGRA